MVGDKMSAKAYEWLGRIGGAKLVTIAALLGTVAIFVRATNPVRVSHSMAGAELFYPENAR